MGYGRNTIFLCCEFGKMIFGRQRRWRLNLYATMWQVYDFTKVFAI